MSRNSPSKPASPITVLRPKPQTWDGPHFRLFQCGFNHIDAPMRPHSLFVDAMEPQPLGVWEYLLSGTMYYRLGDMRYRMQAGQALVMHKPDPGWMLRPCDNEPIRTIWIIVTAEPALQFFNYLHLKYGQIQTFSPDCEAVRMAKRLIRQVQSDPHRPADYWSELTFRWLNAWWRCAKEQHASTGAVPLHAVKPSRLVSYTAKTIKNFAAEMGYSRAYLTRKLTEQWHRSPGRALHEVRLREAARLLRTTRMSIRDIAAQVGYSSSASFCRAFRSQYRQTPRLYRNTNI